MSLSMPCREAVALLTELQENALPWKTQMKLRLHLFRCRGCREILDSLEGLPGFIGQHLETEAPPEARAALSWALEHLGQEPARREIQPGPVPQELLPLLAAGEVGLNIQERVHRALFQGRPRNEAPRVPDAALAELPPMERWRWKRIPFSRVRIAPLLDEAGRTLMVMLAPPGCRYPAHVHLGAESVLVLDGELDDANGHLTTGDWVYYEPGSVHSPMAGEEGCWTLVSIESGFRSPGLLGRLRDLLS